MAHGDRGIAILLLHHQLCHRLADDVGTPQDDTFLAAGLYVITVQQREDAQRCGRNEAWKANGHTPHIDGMEAVYILAVIDGLNDFLLVDMLRQRQLDDEAVYIGILIQLAHTSKQLSFGHVIFIPDECRLESTLFAGDDLILHIRLGTTVVPHEHSRQMRLFSSVNHDLFYFFRNLGLDGHSGCFSVY